MNELLFFAWTVVVVGLVLLSFRFGRVGLYGVIGVYIILANVFVTKQITLFGVAATGGNSLYGAIFLATDLLNEHWGKKEAQRAVWFGWLCAGFFLLASQVFLWFQPSVDDFVHDAMTQIFSLAPRIVAGSLLAYIVSQTHDVIAFNAWKKRTQGRHLWLRNNASTLVSQLLDSVIFTAVAFWGIFEFSILLQIFVTTYLLKVLVAVIDTPFLYLSKRFKPLELR
ncbi:queuosine precursor transporter [bacterium]|nr:queuosine precursor transporter [bacterium]